MRANGYQTEPEIPPRADSHRAPSWPGRDSKEKSSPSHQASIAKYGEKANILLVDDQPANLLALEAVLEELGQNLIKVSSGVEALRYLLTHDVALILMDVRMPEMDGFEAASLIHGRPRSRGTPIIFLTGHDRTDASLFKGYSVGAVDFLTKPFVPEVLKSKVTVFVELHRKTTEMQQQAEILREMQQKEHELELAAAKQHAEAERLRQEMDWARRVQQKLFPSGDLKIPGFDIAGASFPADKTGGDYYDYIPMVDKSLGLVIGDVSGHGMGAALLMATTRAYLHALAECGNDVGRMLTRANRALVADVGEHGFVTLLVARMNPRKRSLVYCNAGHQPGYVLTSTGEVNAVLKSEATPLGVMDCHFAGSSKVTLRPGDLLFLFTDGLVETRDRSGSLFTTERALEVVRANQSRNAREIVAALYDAVRTYSDHRPQEDDVTAVIVKVDGAA